MADHQGGLLFSGVATAATSGVKATHFRHELGQFTRHLNKRLRSFLTDETESAADDRLAAAVISAAYLVVSVPSVREGIAKYDPTKPERDRQCDVLSTLAATGFPVGSNPALKDRALMLAHTLVTIGPEPIQTLAMLHWARLFLIDDGDLVMAQLVGAWLEHARLDRRPGLYVMRPAADMPAFVYTPEPTTAETLASRWLAQQPPPHVIVAFYLFHPSARLRTGFLLEIQNGAATVYHAQDGVYTHKDWLKNKCDYNNDNGPMPGHVVAVSQRPLYAKESLTASDVETFLSALVALTGSVAASRADAYAQLTGVEVRANVFKDEAFTIVCHETLFQDPV